MDSYLWATRLAASKRQYTLQQNIHSSHSDRFGLDGLEVEDDVLPDFPCPYCHEDFDIASLCAHLQEEHLGEPKITICPVCSVKRRHKLRRVAVPDSQALLLLGRELRDAHLQILLGGGGRLRSNNDCAPSTAATDPFLSSLIMNFHVFEEEEEVPKTVTSSIKELSATEAVPSRLWKKSTCDPSLSYKERERRMKQATGRAGFMQDLLLATLLGD